MKRLVAVVLCTATLTLTAARADAAACPCKQVWHYTTSGGRVGMGAGFPIGWPW